MTETWVFAYGSLMWDPGFPHDREVTARLRGYHRALCHYSIRYRGTPARPGLVLALDRGGSCVGRAFRVVPGTEPAALEYLRVREMDQNSYLWRALSIDLPDRRVCAQTFVMNRAHALYAGKLPPERIVEILGRAVGERGSARAYFETTHAHLVALGIHDRRLEAIARALDGARAAQLHLE